MYQGERALVCKGLYFLFSMLHCLKKKEMQKIFFTITKWCIIAQENIHMGAYKTIQPPPSKPKPVYLANFLFHWTTREFIPSFSYSALKYRGWILCKNSFSLLFIEGAEINSWLPLHFGVKLLMPQFLPPLIIINNTDINARFHWAITCVLKDDITLLIIFEDGSRCPWSLMAVFRCLLFMRTNDIFSDLIEACELKVAHFVVASCKASG